MQRELTGKRTDLLKVVLPAATRGDLAAVKSFVKADQQWVHAVGPHYRTMLREAARKGRLDLVTFLLKNGANPSESGLTDWAFDESLAALAAEYGYEFDIDMPNWIGFPALVDESRGNHNMPDDPDRVIALLDKGANVNVTDHKGKTALHRAAQAGFLKITEILMERGAELDAQDDDGETPLFDALKAGRAGTVRLLLDHGASTTVKNRRGRSPLEIAKAAKRPEIRSLAAMLDEPNAH